MRYSEISERTVDPVKLAQRTGRRYGTEPDYGYHQSDTAPGEYIPLKNYNDDWANELDLAFNELYRKFDFYKQPREKRIQIRKKLDQQASTTEPVNIKNLYAYQPFVRISDKEILQKKINTNKTILVVKYQNRLFIRDGHHAVLAARLRGEHQITAEVIDLDLLLKKYDVEIDADQIGVIR